MIEKKFVEQGIKRAELDRYLEKKIKRAGYAGSSLQKTPVATRLLLKIEKPGLVIGKKGSNIKKLTKEVEAKFGLDNLQIKVEEVDQPELDPQVMAKRIASSLERGLHFRRILHWSLNDIMGAGAQGAEITVSGKLYGKGGIARSERVSRGYIKKAGEYSKLVKESQAQAEKKAGVIGVTVKIVPPGVTFPDKIDLSKLKGTEQRKKEAAEKAKKEAAEKKKKEEKKKQRKAKKKEEKKDKKKEKQEKTKEKEQENKKEPEKKESKKEKKSDKEKPEDKKEEEKDESKKTKTDE